MKFPVQFVFACILILCVSTAFAANDRPLIFGQNPVPSNWWSNNPDPLVGDPIEFDRMQESGCGSCRIGVNWDQIEPVRGTRNWSEIDRWVKYANDRNIEVVILINSTPTWALPEVNPDIPIPEARYPPAEEYAEEFMDFVYDVARRYRGRVQYYEFWNEANGYGWHWDEGFSRADEYTPWMIRAYKAIKLADPTAKMSTTGICDASPDTSHAVHFLQGIYAHGGKGYFDAVADHPYPGDGAYFPGWKIQAIRDFLDSRGDNHVDIWITEIGWTANGREHVVAGYITDYFNQLVNNHPSVKIATYHTAMDFPWENYGYGLIDRYFNRKPTWYAFRDYPKPARPAISNVSVTHLSPTSVRVNFTTDVPTRGLVMYGTTDTYGMITGRGVMPTTNHQITLLGLNPGTTYRYRVRAGATEYADSVSANRSFSTGFGSVVQITSGPTVSNVTDSSATISWTTNVSSTSEVQYGLDFSYGGSATSAGLATNHSVELTDVYGGKNYQYRVISTASGYADAAKEGHPFTTPVSSAHLVNGGFEEGTLGWTFWEVYPWGRDGTGNGQVDYPGHVSVNTSNGGVYVPDPATMEGDWRLTHDLGWSSGVGGLYQTIDVPNGVYVVSGWVASGCDGGNELIELKALDGPYTGGIPGGVAVASLTASSAWTHYSKPVLVTTGKLTIATRISQWAAVNLVSGHFDGIEIASMSAIPLKDLKDRSLGETLAIDGDRVVTMVVDDNTFYIQEDDRSMGIMVHTQLPHGLAQGDRASVAGTLGVQNGEALIYDAAVLASSAGTDPKPLAMTNLAIGGAENGVQPGITGASGLGNVGLLVTTWGKVIGIGNDYVYIDDGSGLNDGTYTGSQPNVGLRVLCDPTGLSVGDHLVVTGVSSSFEDGTNIHRMLRARSAGGVIPR